MKLLTLLLALGFVVTIVVAWLLQVTPGGIRLEPTRGKALRHQVQHAIELSVIVVLLIAVGVLAYRQTWLPGGVPDEGYAAVTSEAILLPGIESSIAVLPFKNLGEDPDDRYIGDGLAEEILHKLVRVKSLKVAARTSSFYFGELGLDIPTIAARMLVQHVLEGSVRREGNRTRITAQLVDARGFHLWSEAFDVRSGDILEVQSRVALAVAKAVASNLSPDIRTELAQGPTESEEAFDFYLRGLDYLRRPRHVENLQYASSYIDHALSLDPRFARAHAAACEIELGWYRHTHDVAHFENAERFCNRALTLDADQVEVHTALGNLYRSSSQFDKAQSHFEHALELNPYYEEANYGLAKSLEGQGNLQRAEETLRYSIELEPGYWAPYLSLGFFLHRLGRYEEAIPLFETVTVLTPDNPDGWNNLGTAYFDLGDWESAEIAWLHSVEVEATPMGYRNLGTLYYYQRRYEQAASMHEAALELAPADHWLWGKLGATYRYIDGGSDISRNAYEEAIRLANQHLAVDELDAQTMAYLAAYYVNVGATAEAAELASQAVGLAPDNPEIWYFAGIVNACLDKADESIADLKHAVDLGYSKRLISVDPQFASLHGVSDFQDLIQ